MVARAGRAAVLVVALAVGACAGRLQPAPAATVLPGPGDSAVATAGDVRLLASARAWRGYPRDLGRELIPVLLTIDNQRAAAVSVRYDDIALVAPDGRRLTALAPRGIRGVLTEPVAALPYAAVSSGFAGLYDPWAFYGPWSPWLYDPRPVYARVPLPTPDMLRLALPEATILAGGRLQGFVYFERDLDKGTPLDLVVAFADPATRQTRGVVRIPFVFQ